MTPVDLCIATYGVAPGPGIDVVILATDPISQTWKLQGKTEAGKAYLEDKYPAGQIHGARWVVMLKSTLLHFGMTHTTVFPNVIDRLSHD